MKEGFSGGSDGKESAYNAGDLGSIPGLARSPGGRHGNPLQYSGLENPHGQRSLVGCSLWGCKESDTTEQLTHTHTHTHTQLLTRIQAAPKSNTFCLLTFLSFFLNFLAMWDLSSQTGIKLAPPAVEAQSLKNWTIREGLLFPNFLYGFFSESFGLPLS